MRHSAQEFEKSGAHWWRWAPLLGPHREAGWATVSAKAATSRPSADADEVRPASCDRDRGASARYPFGSPGAIADVPLAKWNGRTPDRLARVGG
jgi:hypothetical protein